MRRHPSPRFLESAALLLLASAALSGSVLPARGQECFPGRDCCVVGQSMDHPRRYAVGCDGAAQSASGAVSASGHPIVLFGPTSFARCGAWMNRAGIVGWDQYAGVPLEPQAIPPEPDAQCFLGRTCCFVGATWDQPPRYAIGYDGGSGRGDHSLSSQGYHSIVHGPVSPEFCHDWWNRNVAARGFGQPFPTAIQGAIPPRGAAGFAGTPPQPGQGPRGRIPGQPPPQTGISIQLTPQVWVRVAPHVGAVSGGPGLVVAGGAWTNGQVKNGRIDGNRVTTQQRFDFGGGGHAYVAFTVSGAGQYMAVVPRVLAGVSVHHMSTHHSWANSVVVPDGTKLFAHVAVDAGGGYRLAVAQGDYDDVGGRVLLQSSGRLANPQVPLEMQFVDNYAGEAAGMTILEAWVYAGAGAPGPSAGGSCASDADCPNSVCLLGVCAPPSPRRF